MNFAKFDKRLLGLAIILLITFNYLLYDKSIIMNLRAKKGESIATTNHNSEVELAKNSTFEFIKMNGQSKLFLKSGQNKNDSKKSPLVNYLIHVTLPQSSLFWRGQVAENIKQIMVIPASTPTREKI